MEKMGHTEWWSACFPGSQTGQEKLAQTRFQIVIEASSLNEAELTAYAQKKGLQVGEIKNG